MAYSRYSRRSYGSRRSYRSRKSYGSRRTYRKSYKKSYRKRSYRKKSCSCSGGFKDYGRKQYSKLGCEAYIAKKEILADMFTPEMKLQMALKMKLANAAAKAVYQAAEDKSAEAKMAKLESKINFMKRRRTDDDFVSELSGSM